MWIVVSCMFFISTGNYVLHHSILSSGHSTQTLNHKYTDCIHVRAMLTYIYVFVCNSDALHTICKSLPISHITQVKKEDYYFSLKQIARLKVYCF